MRYPRRKIRRKRFLFPKKRNLPLFYSQPRKKLIVAYDYEEDIRNETDYLERIEVAVEQFNSLGLVEFIYQPLTETNVTVVAHCPIDEMALKAKHLNQIIFGKIENSAVKMLGYSYMIHPFCSYFKYLSYFSNETVTSISSFASLGCNLAHPSYPKLGIGVLVHELGHTLGITDLVNYNPEKTQHILSYNLTQDALADLYQTCMEKEYNRTDFNCLKVNLLYHANQDADSYAYLIPFTPVSMFSLYQYQYNFLKPYVIFNKTRIHEILTGYGFSASEKDDYFSLLKAYQGHDQLLTYQDLLALALAYTIYNVAPDTLVKRQILLPYVRFIEGMYRPPEEERQLIKLIHTFVKVENFTYPILSQKTAVLSITADTFLQEDLVDQLKLVSLNNGPLSCSLEAHDLPFPGLDLNKHCLLSGVIHRVGVFHLNITIKDRRAQTKNVLIIESIAGYNRPVYKIKHRIFIGSPVVLLKENQTYIKNLVAACLVADYPQQQDLKCAVIEPPYLQPYLNQCALTLPEQAERTEIKIKFFNDWAQQFCTLKYPLSKEIILNETYLSAANSTSIQIYKRSAEALSDRYLGLFSVMPALDYSILYSKQFNYLFTLPLLHGVFEGMVDEGQWSPAIRSILKLLPRLSLIALCLWSDFQWPIFLLYGLVEAYLPNFLDKKMHPVLRNAILFISFMLLTEFEYGCSKLWERADSPQLFSGYSEQFNQLLIQVLWAPMIKIMGYLTTVAVTESCRTIKETAEVSEEESPLASRPVVTIGSNPAHRLLQKNKWAANLPFFEKAANSLVFQNEQEEPLRTLMPQGS